MNLLKTAASILLLVGLTAPISARSGDCDWPDVLIAHDANGDGRLDAKEREVLRKSRPMGFTCDPGRGTWDRAGERRRSQGSGEGKKPPPHPLARFDTNHNGVLEAAELAEAREQMAGRLAKLPPSKSKSD